MEPAAEKKLGYYAFPEERWRRIRSTDEIDKRFFVNRDMKNVDAPAVKREEHEDWG